MNPYVKIAAAMQGETPGMRLLLGTVAAENPLAVDVGGLRITAPALFLPPELAETEFQAEIFLPGSEIVEQNASVRRKKPLKAGDRVVLLSDDDQIFYIICKVVGA